MKKILGMINKLDKVPTMNFAEKSVRNAGVKAMLERARLLYDDEYDITYKPGSGFIATNKKTIQL